METLDELVEQSDRLLMEIQRDTDLPMITRSLEQMVAFGEKLSSSHGTRSDVKAARLLGPTINYDLPNSLSAKLESLSQVGDVEFSQSTADVDIHTFLKCERENILFAASEQAKRSVFEDVDAICSRATSAWWDRKAAAILTALASSNGPLESDILHSLPQTTDTSLSRDYLSRSTTIDLSADPQAEISKEELFYANQVDKFLSETLVASQKLNLHQMGLNAGLLGKPSLFNVLYNTPNAKSVFLNESKHFDLHEVFRLIKRLFEVSAVDVDDVGSSESPLENLPLPRSYDSAAHARSGPHLQAAFLGRAIAHLEAEYVGYLRAIVAANPRVAQLGGRPGVRALVRAFLNLRSPVQQSSGNSGLGEAFGDFEDGLIDGKPVWPMIFYCLRCGALQDALAIASEAANNLGDFATFLSTYVREERSLSSKVVTSIRKIYSRVIKTSRDPYKRLVYCLLGRCDLADAHTEVAQSIDDFMWLRLSQVFIKDPATTDHSDDTGECLKLGQLQTLLFETHGEAHFDASNQPLAYFKVLCLSQQFEGALAFLARFESLRCHALHLALILREMKILLVSANPQAPLLSRIDADPLDFRRLNFARLVLLYTRKFESSNPCQAVNYYYFLHDLASPPPNVSADSATPHSLFIECVAELAIQTGEYGLLLGMIPQQQQQQQQQQASESGTSLATPPSPLFLRHPGAIDRFAGVVPPTRLIASVAQMLETRGQMAEAVVVYRLAGGPQCLLSAVRLTNLLLVGVVGGSPQDKAELGGQLQGDRQALLRLAADVGYSVRRLDPISTSTTESRDDRTESPVMASLQSAARTLYYLLDLSTFFDLAAASQWQAALDHIDRLGLFPTTGATSDEVDAKVAAFASLSDLVRRPLPAALLLLMRCLTAKAAVARQGASCERSFSLGSPSMRGVGSSGIGGGGGDSRLAEARSRARALIAFVGRIPHRMPGEVYARLSQLELQLSSSAG